MTNDEPDAPAPPGRARPHYADRHLGREVRERRLALGMAREELAGLAGIDPRQLDELERGLGHLPAGRLYWVAEALGTEVGRLFEGLGGVPAGGERVPEPGPDLGRGPAAIPGGAWGDTAPGSPVGEFLAAVDGAPPRPAVPADGGGGGGRWLATLLVVLGVGAVGLAPAALTDVRPQEGGAPLAAVPAAPAPPADAELPARPVARLVAREPSELDEPGAPPARALVRRVQERLAAAGLDPGPADGAVGERTRDALREFQRARGLDPTGEPNGPTLGELGVE